MQNELDDNYKSEYNPNIKLDVNEIHQGDCLELMNGIPDKSVDMILCDLPYGTTACKWDEIIPFEPLWKQYERIIKDNGAIVLTASQPFTTKLINSNIKLFRYEWIWEKDQGVNFMMAKKQPLKSHENILIFYKKQPIYNPQMIDVGKEWIKKDTGNTYREHLGLQEQPYNKKSKGTLRYPKTVIKQSNEKINRLHPTQKPVDLFEYLIKTYTNEGALVLDNCAGSFTTAVACDNTNRNWICIEKEEKYCNIGLTRINDNRERLGSPLLNSIITQL